LVRLVGRGVAMFMDALLRSCWEKGDAGLERFPCALRGRLGENETWRRWSVSLGREDWFCSESDEVPDDGMGDVRRTERDRAEDMGGGACPDSRRRSSSAVLSTTIGSCVMLFITLQTR